MVDRHYSAFISYRHVSPDSEVAKKLHSMIENFSIPNKIKASSGIKKLDKVFRDEEELPLSKDLGADIQTALRNSDWLIVLCSKEYLKSEWCKAELDYFISLGKRDHILAILVDGEPEESFPEQLTQIEKDGQILNVEPLAGDVRADSVSGSLKKLKREKLRILAPMLGVSYDDLRQRARRRKTRLTVASFSVVFLLLAGFLTYALVKNDQVTKQRDLALNNEMQLLIEEANVSSDSGDKLAAVQTLKKANLSRKNVGSKNDYLFRSALEYTLYNDVFEKVLTINYDNRSFSSLVFSHNDKYLLGITNLNSACLIDAETGKILFTVSRSDVGLVASVGFTKDDRYFYLVDSWYGYVSVYDVKTGKLYREYDAFNDSCPRLNDKVFPLSDGRMIICLGDRLVIWDYVSDKAEDIFVNGDNDNINYVYTSLVDLSSDEKRLVFGTDGSKQGMKIVNLDGSDEIPLEHKDERGYHPIKFSGDGKYVASLSGKLYCVWDASTGKLVLEGESEKTSPDTDDILINRDGSVIIIPSSTYLCAISTDTGKVLWEKTAKDTNTVTAASISPNGKYVCAYGGINGVFDIKTGKTLCNKGGRLFSNDSGKFLCESYGSNPVLLATPDSATQKTVDNFKEKLFSTERYTEPKKSFMLNPKHNSAEIYSTPPGNANRQSMIYVSPDTKYAALTHYDGFVEVFDVTKSEPKELYCMAEHCYNSVTDLIFNGNLMASCGGFDPRCVIFDLKSGQIKHVLKGSGYVHKCEFSKDGSKIIMLCGTDKDNALVFSTVTGNLLYNFKATKGTKIEEVGFTEKGDLVAAVLSDGSAITGEVYPTLGDLVDELLQR